MNELYIKRLPASCLECNFRCRSRQGKDICLASREYNDGGYEYLYCNQSKHDMVDGRPKACPLKLLKEAPENETIL